MRYVTRGTNREAPLKGAGLGLGLMIAQKIERRMIA